MAKTRDIVYGALRRLGVLDPGETPLSEDSRDTLLALNGIMHSWKRRGLSYTHTTLTLNDTFPLAIEHEEGVKAMLAIRMSDDYAPEAVTPEMRRAAREAWDLLVNQFYAVPYSKFDLPGSLGTSQPPPSGGILELE